MASEIQDTLARIVTKSKVLVEKYHVLLAEKEQLEQQVQQLKEEVDTLRKANEQLGHDNEYLSLARNVVPDAGKTSEVKKLISSLVRDIDKCISQLNE